jgi:hypothetical protein
MARSGWPRESGGIMKYLAVLLLFTVGCSENKLEVEARLVGTCSDEHKVISQYDDYVNGIVKVGFVHYKNYSKHLSNVMYNTIMRRTIKTPEPEYIQYTSYSIPIFNSFSRTYDECKIFNMNVKISNLESKVFDGKDIR